MVGEEGLEPSRPVRPADFESAVSAIPPLPHGGASSSSEAVGSLSNEAMLAYKSCTKGNYASVAGGHVRMLAKKLKGEK